MVAAEDHRQRAALEDLADRRLGVAVAGGGVGMDDVGIADIDDPDLVHRQIDRVVLVVVGAAMAEGEQGRGLADAARAEAGPGPVLGAHVVGHAEHGDVGVERVPVEAGRPLAERAVPDEGQIEAAALVGMHRRLPFLCRASELRNPGRMQWMVRSEVAASSRRSYTCLTGSRHFLAALWPKFRTIRLSLRPSRGVMGQCPTRRACMRQVCPTSLRKRACTGTSYDDRKSAGTV